MANDEEIMDFFNGSEQSNTNNASNFNATKDAVHGSDELPQLVRQPTLNTDIHRHKAELAHKGSLAQRRRPASRVDLWDVFHTVIASNSLMSDNGNNGKENENITSNVEAEKNSHTPDDTFKSDDRTDGMRIYMEANSTKADDSEEMRLPLIKKLGVKLPALGQIGSVKLKKTGKLDMLKSDESEGSKINANFMDEKHISPSVDTQTKNAAESVQKNMHEGMIIDPLNKATDTNVNGSDPKGIKFALLNTETDLCSREPDVSVNRLSHIEAKQAIKKPCSSSVENEVVNMETDQSEMEIILVETKAPSDIEMIPSNISDLSTPKIRGSKPKLEPMLSAGLPVVARRTRNTEGDQVVKDQQMVTSLIADNVNKDTNQAYNMDKETNEADNIIKEINQTDKANKEINEADTIDKNNKQTTDRNSDTEFGMNPSYNEEAVLVHMPKKADTVIKPVKPERQPKTLKVVQDIPMESTSASEDIIINPTANDLNSGGSSTVDKSEYMEFSKNEHLSASSIQSSSTPLPPAHILRDPAEINPLSVCANQKAKPLNEIEDFKSSDKPVIECVDFKSSNSVESDHISDVASTLDKISPSVDHTEMDLVTNDAAPNMEHSSVKSQYSKTTDDIKDEVIYEAKTHTAAVSEFIHPVELSEIEMSRSDAFQNVPFIKEATRGSFTASDVLKSENDHSNNSENLVSMDLSSICEVSPAAEAMSLSIIVREQFKEFSGNFSLSLDDIVSKNDPAMLDDLYGTNQNTSICLKGATTEDSTDDAPNIQEMDGDIIQSSIYVPENALNNTPEAVANKAVSSVTTTADYSVNKASDPSNFEANEHQVGNKTQEDVVPSFYFGLDSEGKSLENTTSILTKDYDNEVEKSEAQEKKCSIDADEKTFYFDVSSILNQKKKTKVHVPEKSHSEVSNVEIPRVDSIEVLEPAEDIHCKIESKLIESPINVVPESKDIISDVDMFYFSGPSEVFIKDKSTKLSSKLDHKTGKAETVETILIQPNVAQNYKQTSDPDTTETIVIQPNVLSTMKAKTPVDAAKDILEPTANDSISKGSNSNSNSVLGERKEINDDKSDVHTLSGATAAIPIVCIPLLKSLEESKDKHSESNRSVKSAVRLSLSPQAPLQTSHAVDELPEWRKEFDRKCRSRKSSNTSQEIIAGRRFLTVATAAGCFTLPKLRPVKNEEHLSDNEETDSDSLIVAPWQKEWEEKKRRRSMADRLKI